MVTDAVDDDIGVLEDEPVREAEDGTANEREPMIARNVASWAREVRRAIRFDDCCGLDAEKVDDESPDRVLSAEFHAVERATTQQLP